MSKESVITIAANTKQVIAFTETALAGQAGLQEWVRGVRWRAPKGGGVQVPIPTTSRRAISSLPGGKRGNVRPRDQRGLPPGSELIGLRQVDGMAWHSGSRVEGRSKPDRTP